MESLNNVSNDKMTATLPAGAWRVVILLFFVACLNYLDRTMLTTMRISILKDMPMKDAQFGLLTAVFLWSYGLMSPFAGFLGDYFKKSRIIVWSLFGWSLITFLTSFATTFQELLWSRVLLGITEACNIPAAMALVGLYHKGSTRSFASGLLVAGIVLGQSLGFTAGWIAEVNTWHTSFLVFGLTGIAFSVFLYFTLNEKQAEGDKQTEVPGQSIHFVAAIKSLFSKNAFTLLILLWSALSAISWMTAGWLPTYYKEHFNLSQSLAGFYATAWFYPAAILGVSLGGFLTSKAGAKLKDAPFIIPAVGLCIAAPCIFIASYSNVLPVAIAMFMLYIFSRSFTDANIMPMLYLSADPRYRSTGFGILNFFACIIGGVGLYAGGILRDMHVSTGKIFQSAVVLIAVCVVLLILLKKHSTSQVKKITIKRPAESFT